MLNQPGCRNVWTIPAAAQAGCVGGCVNGLRSAMSILALKYLWHESLHAADTLADRVVNVAGLARLREANYNSERTAGKLRRRGHVTVLDHCTCYACVATIGDGVYTPSKTLKSWRAFVETFLAATLTGDDVRSDYSAAVVVPAGLSSTGLVIDFPRRVRRHYHDRVDEHAVAGHYFRNAN